MNRIRIGVVMMAACLFCSPLAHASTAGQIRAMEQRAADLQMARNRFLVQVLQAYRIPYRVTPETGLVREIEVANTWYIIREITIVPETEVQDGQVILRGHNIYFQPEGSSNALHLFSDIGIIVPH
ncbi:MAG: hypothetical protein HY788_11980 [Deltaproteobacteria bacterium]|nr:hypothetical protein [Deltaproteobacteria bacterium]